MRVERRKYRLRFLNASNARSYTLRLGSGHPMTQIAGDGGLLERPVRRRSIPIHPAERIDLVIDFRDYRPGTELVLQNTEGSGGTVAIMRFDVVRGGGEDARVPRRLKPLDPLPKPVTSRTWDLALGTAAWEINGKSFDPTRIDVAPKRGTVGALDLRQPLRPRAPDASARVPVPGAVAIERARSIRPTGSGGRTRSACCERRR